MTRRAFLTSVAALAAGRPLRLVAQDLQRTAVVVTRDDLNSMISALNFAVELSRYNRVRDTPVDIRIIAHGPGLRIFREDTSPVLSRLKFTLRSMPDISLVACAATAADFQRTEGDAPPILSQARSVPVAADTVEEMRADGWTIVEF